MLKEQSRPSVSDVTSADVSLTTALGGPRFCDVIGSRHKFHCVRDGPRGTEIVHETDETDPLRH